MSQSQEKKTIMYFILFSSSYKSDVVYQFYVCFALTENSATLLSFGESELLTITKELNIFNDLLIFSLYK